MHAQVRRLIIVAAGLALLVGGAVPSRAQTTPYTLDAILDLTGSNAFAGDLLSQSLRVFERYVNTHGGIRGRDLHVVFHDEQSNPQMAVSLATEILAGHPAAILGGGATSSCAAIAALVRDGPVDFCFSPGFYPDKGSYAFALSPSLKYILTTGLNFVRQHGLRRIALISATDATGHVSEQVLSDLLATPQYHDLTLVTSQHFNATDLSVAAQATQVGAAKPDVVFCFAGGTPFGTVLRNLNDAGVHVPVLTSSANVNLTQLDQYKNYLPPALYFNGSIYQIRDQLPRGNLRDTIDAFIGAFRAANTEVTPTSGFAWDPGLLIVSGLRTLGTNATAQQLRDYLLGLRGFAGASGVYDFSIGDQHGLTEQAVIIVAWDPATRTFPPVSGPGGAPLGKKR